ncbi:UNVERIFIED_CONTAM: hypothetical protein NCL1_21271 [Trichonephila clavipes]
MPKIFDFRKQSLNDLYSVIKKKISYSFYRKLSYLLLKQNKNFSNLKSVFFPFNFLKICNNKYVNKSLVY